MPGIEPGPPRLSPRTVRPPMVEDNRSTSAHRNSVIVPAGTQRGALSLPKQIVNKCTNGQEAGICTRTVRFTGGDAAVTPQS